MRRAALRHRLRRSATRGLAAAVFAAIPSFLILPPTTARYSVFAPNPSFLEYWLPIVLFVSLPVVTAAVVGYWPRRGDQMAVTASFAGMLLLIALVLVLWLQGDVVAGASKTAVVVLLALVAFMLLRYLRRGRSGQSAVVPRLMESERLPSSPGHLTPRRASAPAQLAGWRGHILPGWIPPACEWRRWGIEGSLTGRGACARVPIVQICTIGTT